jgi:hypothetical protein
MSTYPRTVLTDITVTWGGEPVFVRHGTVVDIVPGSALEAAYGGSSNLTAVLPPWQRSDGSHAGVGN